jgi:hypothetical protein
VEELQQITEEHGMLVVDMKCECKTYKSIGKAQKENFQKRAKRLECICCDSSGAVGQGNIYSINTICN